MVVAQDRCASWRRFLSNSAFTTMKSSSTTGGWGLVCVLCRNSPNTIARIKFLHHHPNNTNTIPQHQNLARPGRWVLKLSARSDSPNVLHKHMMPFKGSGTNYILHLYRYTNTHTHTCAHSPHTPHNFTHVRTQIQVARRWPEKLLPIRTWCSGSAILKDAM